MTEKIYDQWEILREAGLQNRIEALRKSVRRCRECEQPIWISVIGEAELEREISTLIDLSKGGENLPLLGLSFGVKDNIDVAGLPTTAACPSFSRLAVVDAPVVARLRAAGAVPIGKTNMDQFATGLVGTRSPYGRLSSVFSDRHISGGSSSGSAVAVARGQVCFSLGTDTAGSGRVPAAFNGLVGLKPTKGLVSTRGVTPACRTLDCVSVFTHRIEQAEIVLALIQGFDQEDPFSRCAPGAMSFTTQNLRLGSPPRAQLEFFGDSEAAALFAGAQDKLLKSVASLADIDYEPFSKAAKLLYEGGWLAERTLAVGDHLEAHPEDADPIVRQIVLGGRDLKATEVFFAMLRLAELRRQTEEAWSKMDVLVLPTTPTNYSFDEVDLDPVGTNARLGTYTNFVNLLDLCALALPAGHKSDGTALGVTLLAPAFQEDRLFALGRRYLQAIEVGRDIRETR